MGVVAQPVTFPPQVRHMALLGLCVLTPIARLSSTGWPQ